MNMGIRLVSLILVVGFIAGTHGGCVRSSTYEKTKKQLDDVNILYLSEQLKNQDLKDSNKHIKQQMEELATTLASWRNQVARTQRDYERAQEQLVSSRVEEGRLRSRDVAAENEFRQRLTEIKSFVKQIQALLAEN